MPIGCHFRDCKTLLVTSLTHVSGAITSVQTFTFTLDLLGHGRLGWPWAGRNGRMCIALRRACTLTFARGVLSRCLRTETLIFKD